MALGLPAQTSATAPPLAPWCTHIARASWDSCPQSSGSRASVCYRQPCLALPGSEQGWQGHPRWAEPHPDSQLPTHPNLRPSTSCPCSQSQPATHSHLATPPRQSPMWTHKLTVTWAQGTHIHIELCTATLSSTGTHTAQRKHSPRQGHTGQRRHLDTHTCPDTCMTLIMPSFAQAHAQPASP